MGIAPEHRGSGVAFFLLQQTLEELRAAQVPLSALYPATQRLYRKAGYEQGGSFCTWELSTDKIQIQDHSLPLVPVALSDPILPQLYQQQARLQQGHLDRHPAIWRGITEPKPQEPVYAYLLGSAAQPEGYLICSQHSLNQTGVLRLRDWGVLTAAAARRFWAFLADHRSQIDQVRWQDGTRSPLMLFLPEQTATPRQLKTWMLRIVDVVGALQQRGYPAQLEAELHLAVQDSLLATNQATLPWRWPRAMAKSPPAVGERSSWIFGDWHPCIPAFSRPCNCNTWAISPRRTHRRSPWPVRYLPVRPPGCQIFSKASIT